MGLSVTTVGQSTRLTTRAAVRAELGSPAAALDSLIEALIDRASAAICGYCRRSFAREVLSETLPGFGDIHLQLARTPVVAVSSVTVDSGVVTDYSIADRDRGWLYRRAGWAWTVQAYPGLSGAGRFMDMGSPYPRQEEPSIAVAYAAGYILPEQNLYGDQTISAAAADNSINSSAKFPTLLKAGDVIEISGFVTAANNGRFQVTGTPTASKIPVSGTLSTEAAGPAVTIRFLPPAECRPFEAIEQACIEAVKAWTQGRERDPNVTLERVGDVEMQFAVAATAAGAGLPPSCVGLLAPWVRAA